MKGNRQTDTKIRQMLVITTMSCVSVVCVLLSFRIDLSYLK